MEQTHRVSARTDKDFFNKVSETAQARGLTKQKFVTLALEAAVQPESMAKRVDALEKDRDRYKQRCDEKSGKLLQALGKLRGYEKQGFWGRLFGRSPEPEVVSEEEVSDLLS